MKSKPVTGPGPVPRRATEVRRLRRVLDRRSWPRLQMTLIVALTGGVGLLASVLLHAAGMHAMALRYPGAVLLAYLAFLGLLWLWLHGTQDDYEQAIDGALDLANLPPRSGEALGETALADDGLAGGAGESGAFDALGGADEGLPLLLVALVAAACLAVLLAALSVIWSAPVLFAELLFDGALAAGLYRRLARAERRHWLESALRHTAWPFAFALLGSAALGALLHWQAPHATTLAQVFGG
jgi:hypothetical protein